MPSRHTLDKSPLGTLPNVSRISADGHWVSLTQLKLAHTHAAHPPAQHPDGIAMESTWNCLQNSTHPTPTPHDPTAVGREVI